MSKLTGLIFLLFLSSYALAKNIGHYGQVFPVIEKDIREVIFKKLYEMEASGALAKAQQEVTARVSAHIFRPKPLALTTTATPKSFHIDPTIKVSHDIWTPSGVLVAHAGQRLNPFEFVTFSKTLFFFNGDDKHQVAWVKKHYQDYANVKFILTGGDVREMTENFGRIYFDLGGRLTSLLHIQHVPSVVNQDERAWLVKEIGVGDE